MHRAVFLDRDGVLNKAIVRDGRPYAPTRLEEFEVLPRVPALLSQLKDAGLLLVVVTNQPDVATGKVPRQVVDAMHDRLKATLPVDCIKTCFCTEDSGAACYKPKPGMLLDAADELDIDLGASFMVGDRWRDVGAGKAAGCRTYFIDCGYREALRDTPDHTFPSLENTVGHILANL